MKSDTSIWLILPITSLVLIYESITTTLSLKDQTPKIVDHHITTPIKRERFNPFKIDIK
jgi:hypothetical protein